MHHNTPYYLAFQKIGVGAGTLRRLRETIPDLAKLWNAARTELESAGISRRFIDHFLAERSRINLNTIVDDSLISGTTIIGLDDPAYPFLLRETSSPPLVVFVRGDTSIMSTRCLTVVGTRTISSYGRAVTAQIVQPLAAAHVTIVSGLAFGIDAAAHAAALAAKGKTIAVLGSSVDIITPISNTSLGQNILEHGGAIISEYPPRTRVQKHHFPQRNRILAGLSKATLVIEAGSTSGALITASMALEEGRDVLAVPGPITSEQCAGTHQLLRNGATLITSADDVREALGLDIVDNIPNHIQIEARSETESMVLSLLREPRHIDELVEVSTLDASVINATLSILELRGLVRHLGSARYIRT